MDGNVEFILKVYCYILLILDIALLAYTINYYFKEYKKSSDDILDVLKKVQEKANKGEYNKKSVLTSVVESVSEEDPSKKESSNGIPTPAPKVLFSDAFNELSDEQKGYYDEVVDYALSFDNTNINSFDYERRIKIGQRKMLAIISIKSGTITVKIKMGNLKVGKGLEPLKLKPIRVSIKSKEDLEEAKKQIENCYLKNTGAINVNVEEDE